MEIQRLFNSEFHARSSDAGWRAGLTLWMKSFHQVPAGSVPDDDVALARLAELARDVKAWRKVKEEALYGWIKCSDGRWYHPVVVEKVTEAWIGKKSQRMRTAKARLGALLTRLSKADDASDAAHLETSVQTLLSEMSQHLPQNELEAVTRSVTDSVAESKRKREGKRQGQGQGDFKVDSVPNGTGAAAPVVEPEGQAQDPAVMTKTELWTVGKSLLAASMPKAQCGTFVGKLCKEYGDDIVIEAVRSTVVAQPADPASFLKADCQRRAGERTSAGGARWWSTDESMAAKGAENGVHAYTGESRDAFQARIEAAMANGGKPPPPPPQRLTQLAGPVVVSEAVARRGLPEGVDLKAALKPKEPA